MSELEPEDVLAETEIVHWSPKRGPDTMPNEITSKDAVWQWSRRQNCGRDTGLASMPREDGSANGRQAHLAGSLGGVCSLGRRRHVRTNVSDAFKPRSVPHEVVGVRHDIIEALNPGLPAAYNQQSAISVSPDASALERLPAPHPAIPT